MKIEIGDKLFKVELAQTLEEKRKGLQDITTLPIDEGMLFIYDSPQTVEFWMKDTKIPLDIIFIDEDCEVISVFKGEPESELIAKEHNVKYVLELNQNSGIKTGDELDETPDEVSPTLKVIAPDGSVQVELEGGERIFSIKNTKTLLKMAKRAYESKEDKDYKSLGKKLFKYLKIQNSNPLEYVETKD